MSAAPNNQYQYAAELAQDANHAAEYATEIFGSYSYQRDRMIEWDRTMAPSRATATALVILFPVIAIIEYFFSEELYRNVVSRYPWAMGLIFAALAILIAELIVYTFFKTKRQWKASELKRSESWINQPVAVIKKHVIKITQRQLLVGILLFISMIAILTYMSWYSVDRMIDAGVRINSFGPIYLLPVIGYVFEVFTGMFIWYIILRLFLGLEVASLRRKFNTAARVCNKLRMEAVQEFIRAERNIHLATDYKFRSDQGTVDGSLTLNLASFLRLCPEVGNKREDFVRTIKAELETNGSISKEAVNVDVDIDSQEPQSVLL
jgi:hypothetical protein